MEDWEVIGYSYVRATNYSAMAFFVSWIIVGKYIFLTLFLAVTLEAFESKYDTKIADEVDDFAANGSPLCKPIPRRADSDCSAV